MQGIAFRAARQCLETFLGSFRPCDLMRIRPSEPVAWRTDSLDPDNQASRFAQILRQPIDLRNDLGRHFARCVSGGAGHESVLHVDDQQSGAAGREIVMNMGFSTTF